MLVQEVDIHIHSKYQKIEPWKLTGNKSFLLMLIFLNDYGHKYFGLLDKIKMTFALNTLEMKRGSTDF